MGDEGVGGRGRRGEGRKEKRGGRREMGELGKYEGMETEKILRT